MANYHLIESCRYNQIIELLLSGTDERTTLNSRGLSNYGIDFSDESLTNRGSCTCNLITNDHIDYLADKIGGVSTDQGWAHLVSEVEKTKVLTGNA